MSARFPFGRIRQALWAPLAVIWAATAGPALAGAPLPEPPLAPAGSTVDVLHGTAVPDPYRALEDVKAPATRAWLQAQGEHAAAGLARIDVRAALQRRITALGQGSGEAVREVRRMAGGQLFYLKRPAGGNSYQLMTRASLKAPERVLVDVQALSARHGEPHAVNWFSPSWDGKRLAFGLSAGGSEDSALHLIDVASGRPLREPVPRVLEALVSWSPDNQQLFFNQMRELPAGAPAAETYLDSSVLRIRLAAPAATPQPVFGPLLNTTLGLERLDVAGLRFSPDGQFVVARTTDTTVPEGKLFVAPAAALLGDTAPAEVAWRRLATAADGITDLQMRGDTLYLRTHAGAPRGRWLALDLARGEGLAQARTVVPEPANGVLQALVPVRSGLWVEVFEGFSLKPHFQATEGGPLQALPLPDGGGAWILPDPGHAHADVLLLSQDWSRPSRVLRARPGQVPQDTGLRQWRMPQGAPALTVREVRVPSHDGTEVPVAVLHRKGLRLDGRRPTLLIGYGAYGLSIEAHFTARQLAWLERGGVVAYVNPRGSGALGDAWYRAGFKATKPNTWKDGIAAAHWLVAQHYASPATLGIWGTSAGGIFVGRAVTEAPTLFAAAVFEVGMMDAVRAELSANGATNTSEFGTVQDPAEFRALLAMSTYHQMRDGVRYPAVLLIHGLNDPRVDVWNSAKAAARLQAIAAALPPEAGPARPAWLRLDSQAGHGIGSTAAQYASELADAYAFLLWQFGQAGAKN